MGGEVSLKLPFILGHVDDLDPEVDNSKALLSHTTTKIIEEECGQEDGVGPQSPFLKEQPSMDSQPEGISSAISGGSGNQNGKSDVNVDVIVEANPFDTDQLADQFKIARLRDGDEDAEPEQSANIITAQIHHHQPSNEEPTDS